jgi:hypothetical protein
LKECRDLADRQRLDQNFPTVAEAYLLYTNPMRLKRWEVEARLLAKETDATIAAKCGGSVEGAQMYGKLFFDVRPRLSADTYIYLVVLEGKGHLGIRPDDVEALLKHFGYAFGGLAVDNVLEHIREPPAVPICLNRLDLPALKKLRGQLTLKFDILLLNVPATAIPAATWERLRRDFVAARRVTQIREDDEAAALCSIKATLDVAAIVSGSPADAVCETGLQCFDCDKLIGEQNSPWSVPA